jgi:hypothetical protein
MSNKMKLSPEQYIYLRAWSVWLQKAWQMISINAQSSYAETSVPGHTEAAMSWSHNERLIEG